MIQKIGYIAVGAAATVLLQHVLKSRRTRALHAATSDGRVVAIADWKRRNAIARPEIISEG